MHQSDLDRQVSRVTGDSLSTIKRLGFLIASPARAIRDPEAECLGPHVIDWDELHVSSTIDPAAEPAVGLAWS